MDLVAIDHAFYGGRLLKPGEPFVFYGEKAPKWAAEPVAAAASLSKKKAAAESDMKPKAARDAVARKASIT